MKVGRRRGRCNGGTSLCYDLVRYDKREWGRNLRDGQNRGGLIGRGIQSNVGKLEGTLGDSQGGGGRGSLDYHLRDKIAEGVDSEGQEKKRSKKGV